MTDQESVTREKQVSTTDSSPAAIPIRPFLRPSVSPILAMQSYPPTTSAMMPQDAFQPLYPPSVTKGKLPSTRRSDDHPGVFIDPTGHSPSSPVPNAPTLTCATRHPKSLRQIRRIASDPADRLNSFGTTVLDIGCHRYRSPIASDPTDLVLRPLPKPSR